MKTKKYCFILVLIIASNAHAQLSGGIRAGGNYTNILVPSNQKYYKFKPGFHAGAYMEYDFTEKLSFQTEVVYSKKGCDYKYSNSSSLIIAGQPTTITTDYKVRYDLAYIDVPFLLNINFGEMGSYIGLGPQVSFLVSSRSEGEITNTISNPYSVSTFTYPSNKDIWNKVDFGAVIGTGSKFASGIEYCIRAGYGLTSPVVFYKSSGVSSDEKYHHLVFTISLGYAFGQTSGSYVSGGKYSKRRRH